MAQFQFRLQSVLNLREKLEDQKEIEYAQALKALEEERAKERALRSKKNDKIEALRLLVMETPDPREVFLHNEFIEALKEKIAAQIKVVRAAAEFAENKRLELVEAMRDRKTIERLRENALEEYYEEEKQIAQKQIDEVVSYRYANAL